MRAYVYQRLLLAIPTLFGVTIVIFIAMRILPGDPLRYIYGEAGGIHILTEEELAGARATLGLDRPLYMQYLSWMKDIAVGDFGHSFWQRQPIRDTLLRRGPITMEIAIVAVFFSWIIGLPVGILAAVWRNSWIDYVSRLLVTFFMAVPGFWLALMMVLFTIIVWQWRPPLEVKHLWSDPIKNLQIIAGPSFVMAIGLAAVLARMARATLLEVYNEDYVRTARAKGLRDRVVTWRHALRNALLPVITVSGIHLAVLLGGSVAVERAFAVPGLGTTLVEGIGERDWMIIQNIVLLYGVVFVFINLLIDLTYAFLDPRIRYGG